MSNPSQTWSVGPSNFLIILSILLHGIALYAVFLATLEGWEKLLLVLIIGIHFYWQWKQRLSFRQSSVSRLEVHHTQWILHRHDGSLSQTTLSPNSWVTSYFMILCFLSVESHRKEFVILSYPQMTASAWCQLFVYLRLGSS